MYSGNCYTGQMPRHMRPRITTDDTDAIYAMVSPSDHYSNPVDGVVRRVA